MTLSRVQEKPNLTFVKGCYVPSNCVPVYKVASVMFNSVTPWTAACQAPLSMGFSREEYWSGLPCPSPGGLPDPGMEPASLSVSCTGRQVLYH